MPDTKVEHEIIYDWNLVDTQFTAQDRQLLLHDETLRDGLQSAYVVHPSVEEKIELVRLMDALSIDSVDIGLPGAGEKNKYHCKVIARAINNEKMKIKPTAAARTVVQDIQAIIDVSQSSGIPIEVMAFIGSSPIRMFAEEWDASVMLKRTVESIELAVKEGLPVTFVTEDTTRSKPEMLYKLFTTAIQAGASRICLCDTVGHSTPDGIKVLLRFVGDMIRGLGVPIGIDWHGHNDRGLAVPNSIWAFQFGATRIHGCALGVGERAGNAAMDQLIMNFRLLRVIDKNRNLTRLLDYCNTASKILHFSIPPNYPLAGKDVFRTQTGVHASAILKARKKGDDWLADRIYSGVPAGIFGRKQEVCIGPMSGASNVIFYLQERGIKPTEKMIQKILETAKNSDLPLPDGEILRVVRRTLEEI